jgi:heme a synthase
MSEQSNSQNAPYNGGIHGLSWFVAVLAFVVVCLGGATKSKEAGLTIADPVTFAWMPEWLTTENINAEYTHRIVAFLLACSTLLLMGLILTKENRSAVRKLAVSAFLAVVAQAVLGALTVKFLAKAHTSIPHAVLGQSFFCIAVCLICVTSRAWISGAKQTQEEGSPSMRKLGVWLMIAIVVQLLLGAALRHDNKAEALRNGNESTFIWHLVAHVLGAFAVLFFAARVMSRVFRQHREIKTLLTPTHALMGLLTLQIGLGATAKWR